MTRRKPSGLILCLTVLLALLTLASCGASSATKNEQEIRTSVPVTGADVAPEASGDLKQEDGAYERKIARTVDMSCEATDFDGAIAFLRGALETHGGYVSASSSTGRGVRDQASVAREATFTLRVPSAKLDGFLAAIRNGGGIRVLQERVQSEELTAAYYDVASRLETLDAEKASLSEMLRGFGDYQDMGAMLQVQERLYDVIEEAEALKTRLRVYDDRVALSTVTLSLSEVQTYTEVEAPSFAQRLRDAFVDSWQRFGRGCQSFSVAFVRAFPTLLTLACVAGAIALIVVGSARAAERKRKRKRP